MRGRRKKDEAAPPPGAVATPFFARFLEDQQGDDAEARVNAHRGRASYTEKQGARKATAAKTTAAKLQTLKYPSDNDEYVLYPYKVEAATIKGSTRQTLKYPSDRDEDIGPYVPVYLDAADAPKNARAKAKKDAKIRLTTKADDIDQVAS